MDERKRRMLLIMMWHNRRKTRKTRSFWIHPLLESRQLMGEFVTLFHELREDSSKFFNYFRMSIGSFDELCAKLQDDLQKEDTHMRSCIPPMEMVAVTLRYFATGCSFTDLHHRYKLGISTISGIVQRVSHAIWNVLVIDCIPKPTEEKWKSSAAYFEIRANFPHCIGAVDGKHIRIIKPEHTGSMYFNYKHYFSIVLLAVVDSDYKFSYVDIGAYGKDCDSTVFKNTTFWKALKENTLAIPPSEPLEPFECNVPYVLVGDEAFALDDNLLRPFGSNNLSFKKKIFNYRLTRARRYVECAFGILSNKWRIFHRPLNVSTELAVAIVKACCVLHNYVRERDGYNPQDTLTISANVGDVPNSQSVRGGLSANSNRNLFADYFLSDRGKIPWQHLKI